MLTYIGTKTVKAHPMTRGEYNAYRDWKPPEGEDQTVEGYLVEYAPVSGEVPNHEDHEGYITWSPATAFNASYRPANTWQERLRIEGSELADRLVKLRAFMETGAYATLPWMERDALNRQMQHMAAYEGVLRERYQRAPTEAAAVGDAIETGDFEEDTKFPGDPANPEIDAPAADAVDDDTIT